MNTKPIYLYLTLFFLFSSCKEKNLPYMEKWLGIGYSFSEATSKRFKRIEAIEAKISKKSDSEKKRAKEILELTLRKTSKLDSIFRHLEDELNQGFEGEDWINTLNQSVPPFYLTDVEKILDEYVDELNAIYNKQTFRETFKKLTITQKGQSFYQENFEGEPLVVVEAQLYKKQFEMLGYAEKAMLILYEISITNQFQEKDNQMSWYVLADSDVIEEGQSFVVRLMWIQNNPYPNDLRIKVNGEDIPIINGVGKIRLKAKGEGLQKIIGEVTFQEDTAYYPKYKEHKEYFTSHYYVLPK